MLTYRCVHCGGLHEDGRRNPCEDWSRMTAVAEELWDPGTGAEPAQGPPPRDQEAAYYEYGTYGEVQVWALKDGTAVTCYAPTMKYLRWRNRDRAFQYARRMSSRARILNRMLEGDGDEP